MGRRIIVSNVDVTSPPITTVASGRCTSAPSPVERAIGRNPSEATRAVIVTGRRRSRVPMMTTRRGLSTPRACSDLKAASRTMPLRTATPKSAMKPTPAEMLNGIPRSTSAAIPPMEASGTAEKISSACVVLENVRYRRNKISSIATGTATERRRVAAARFSN